MRKILVLLLILMISLPAGLFGAESKSSSSKDNNELDNVYPDLLPEPYDPDEYPAWTKKLRRATVVFVGSYPLSVFFTKLGIDLMTGVTTVSALSTLLLSWEEAATRAER